MADAVERQLAAYNEGDIDAFVACFDERVVVEDGAGNQLMKGAAELRQTYGPLFRDRPGLKAELLWRERLGEYVVDVEAATGLAGGPQRGVAIYRLDERGLIVHVRFIR